MTRWSHEIPEKDTVSDFSSIFPTASSIYLANVIVYIFSNFNIYLDSRLIVFNILTGKRHYGILADNCSRSTSCQATVNSISAAQHCQVRPRAARWRGKPDGPRFDRVTRYVIAAVERPANNSIRWISDARKSDGPSEVRPDDNGFWFRQEAHGGRIH